MVRYRKSRLVPVPGKEIRTAALALARPTASSLSLSPSIRDRPVTSSLAMQHHFTNHPSVRPFIHFPIGHCPVAAAQSYISLSLSPPRGAVTPSSIYELSLILKKLSFTDWVEP